MSTGLGEKQEIIGGFRLSPQQKHVWSLHETTQNLPYRSQCMLRLDGDLKVEILQQALHRTLELHEILRTTFHCLAEMTVPIQVIADRGTLGWDTIDLRGVGAADLDAALDRVFEHELRRSFNFAEGP